MKYQMDEWKKKHDEIKEEGNRKRAEAAKEQHTKSKPYAGEKMVADHNELLPPRGKNVAREARAAEAHNCGDLSPATLYLIVGSMAFAFSTYLANLPARRTVAAPTPCSLASFLMFSSGHQFDDHFLIFLYHHHVQLSSPYCTFCPITT